MSAARYRTIVEETGVGLYGYPWRWALEAKGSPASRLRIVSSGYRERVELGGGIVGGCRSDQPIYLDRDSGRAVLRAYRRARIATMRGDWGRLPREAAYLEVERRSRKSK